MSTHEPLYEQIDEAITILESHNSVPCCSGGTVISALCSLDEQPLEIIHFAVTIFSKIIGLEFQNGKAYGLSKLFDVGHVACRKHFLCPEMFVPVGVALSGCFTSISVPLTPADLLSNWRQQELSSQGDTASCVTRMVGRVHCCE
jgi:hypothetical protein